MFRMLVGTIWHKYMYNKWYGSYKIDLIYDFLDQKTKCDVKKAPAHVKYLFELIVEVW